MGKNDALLAHLKDPDNIFKNNLIHYVVASLCVSHLFDTIE